MPQYDAPPSVRHIVLFVLKSYEKMYTENEILKTMISKSSDMALRQLWEHGLKTLSVDPDIQAAVKERFAPLYARAIDAADEAVAFEVLQKLPQTNQPN